MARAESNGTTVKLQSVKHPTEHLPHMVITGLPDASAATALVRELAKRTKANKPFTGTSNNGERVTVYMRESAAWSDFEAAVRAVLSASGYRY